VTEYEVDVSKARQGFADMVNFAAYGGGRVLIARRNMEENIRRGRERQQAEADGAG